MGIVIKSGASKKTLHERNMNREHSTEGKKREIESQKLQASVQGELSDLVRESPDGIVPDEKIHKMLENRRRESEQVSPKGFGTTNPKIVECWGIRDGKYQRLN